MKRLIVTKIAFVFIVVTLSASVAEQSSIQKLGLPHPENLLDRRQPALPIPLIHQPNDARDTPHLTANGVHMAITRL